MRLLLVDSHLATRDALSQLLAADGFSVDSADSLTAVAPLIMKEEFAALLVDYSNLAAERQALSLLVPHHHRFHILVLGSPPGVRITSSQYPFETIEKPVDYSALVTRLRAL